MVTSSTTTIDNTYFDTTATTATADICWDDSSEWTSTFIGYSSTIEELKEIFLYQDYIIIRDYIIKILKLTKWHIVFMFNCFMIRAPCKITIKENRNEKRTFIFGN